MDRIQCAKLDPPKTQDAPSMTNRDADFVRAHDAVCHLIDTFERNEQRFLSYEYSEAEARLDFIDKAADVSQK